VRNITDRKAADAKTLSSIEEVSCPRVLVVEDETALREELVDFLKFYGIDAHGVGDIAGMLHQLKTFRWDVLVLDLGLPDGDGLTAARRVRESFKLTIGMVIITARGHVEDRIAGLTAGADSYLVKPVNPRELKAVIDQLVPRLSHQPEPFSLTPVAGWHLDLLTLQLISPDQRATSLTGTEARLVEHLIRAGGRTVGRDGLLQHLAMGLTLEDTRRLDTRISRLRKKVADTAGGELPIKTFRSQGYAFVGAASVGG
jgi:DNA-binding response OmpR family regulator